MGVGILRCEDLSQVNYKTFFVFAVALGSEKFILDSLFRCIGATNAQFPVINVVLELVDNFLDIKEKNENLQEELVRFSFRCSHLFFRSIFVDWSLKLDDQEL